MKKVSKVTYSFTPEEAAQILREYICSDQAQAAKAIVNFNVKNRMVGYGYDEHSETVLESIDVVVTE